MQDYRHASHRTWGCKGHLIWTKKYRHQVSGGDVRLRCRELLREIARSKEIQIYAGSINRDNVHVLVSIPPRLPVLRAVQYLNGKSSRRLLSEFRSLKKRYCAQRLEARRYLLASSGNVTD